MSPSGTSLNQQNLVNYSQDKGIIILCGRFEGVDARVIESLGFKEISIGDYVVHRNHGIGLFQKIEKLNVNGESRDYFVIKYIDGKLSVAADQLGPRIGIHQNPTEPIQNTPKAMENTELGSILSSITHRNSTWDLAQFPVTRCWLTSPEMVGSKKNQILVKLRYVDLGFQGN